MRSNQFKKHLLHYLLPLTLLTLGSCEFSAEPQASGSDSKQQLTQGTDSPVPGEESNGFRVIFDGESFSGWHGYGGADAASRWWVNDGALTVSGLGDGQVDLVTDMEYGNFELRLEWKISPAGNSGIIFSLAETPEYSRTWKTGPEIQILDNDGHADSGPKHRAGDLYDLVASQAEMSRPVGEWNETRLLVENGLVKHWLNGTLVFEVQMWNEAWNELVAGSKFGSMPGFGKYYSGRIALQDHGDVVAFRNIRIREQ